MSTRKRPLVVLVHGIRTGARWFRRIKPVLEKGGDCIVEPAGFGFLDIFSFAIPGLRGWAVNTVRWKINHAIHVHGDRPLIIVAHSFGTFCVTRVLKDNPQIKPVRMLFCGGIVAQGFRWDSLKQSTGMKIVNECGSRDVWPLLAHSGTYGYGKSGAMGFQTAGIEDRFHDLGHSDFFTSEFVEKFWVPFVKDGEVVASAYENEMPEPPWWRSIIGMRPILPWLAWLTIFAFVWVFLSIHKIEAAPAATTSKAERQSELSEPKSQFLNIQNAETGPAETMSKAERRSELSELKSQFLTAFSGKERTVRNAGEDIFQNSRPEDEMRYAVPAPLSARMLQFLDAAAPDKVDGDRPDLRLSMERGEALTFLVNSGADMLPFLRFTALKGHDPKYRTTGNFSNADMRRYKSMRGSYLPGVNLEFSNLSGVDFSGSTFVWGVLRNARLVGTNLYRCNMHAVELEGADLSGANLEGAHLRRADLRRTNLTGLVGWENVSSWEGANIFGVVNPPEGFMDAALSKGAVSDPDSGLLRANVE